MEDTKAAPAADQPDRRQVKERRGVVVSAKMQKTVVVQVTRRVRHSKYGKYLTRVRKFAAHDELGCSAGDQVVIRETRPMSKTKRWRVVSRIATGSES